MCTWSALSLTIAPDYTRRIRSSLVTNPPADSTRASMTSNARPPYRHPDTMRPQFTSREIDLPRSKLVYRTSVLRRHRRHSYLPDATTWTPFIPFAQAATSWQVPLCVRIGAIFGWIVQLVRSCCHSACNLTIELGHRRQWGRQNRCRHASLMRRGAPWPNPIGVRLSALRRILSPHGNSPLRYTPSVALPTRDHDEAIDAASNVYALTPKSA
jgi:hypothetical protein